MTDKQSDALHLADIADDGPWTFVIGVRKEIATELRRQHIELETLRTGYAAARLEVGSLRKEHADELAVAYMCGASREKELAAQQPGGAYAALPESLILAVDRWFSANTGLGGCSDKDVRELAELFYAVTHAGGRESVDDALAIVESLGPGISGINDTYARQILLANEVKRLRASHGQAPAPVLHLVNDAFAEVAMAYPKAFALHKVGIADTAVREALAAPADLAGPSKAITASIMRDDGGDHPAFCLMVAYRSQADAEAALELLAAAPTTQPAPQQEAQEPVAGQCRFPGVVWSECSPEHVRMVLANPEEWKRYEVRYLYTEPQPSPAAQGDALDAADIRHGYTAKRDGSILNPDGQPLIPYQSGKGYLRVSLCRDGKRADEYVHRLIAAAFCTRLSDEQTQVNHRDGDRLNNRASNLEWCSPQENSIHAARVLFAQETRAVIGTSLTDGSTVQFQSLSEAEDHGFKRANIQKVIDGKRRSHGGFTWVDAAQEGK